MKTFDKYKKQNQYFSPCPIGEPNPIFIPKKTKKKSTKK